MISRFFTGMTGIFLLLALSPAIAERSAETIDLDIGTSINLALSHNREIQLDALETESEKLAFDNRLGYLIPDITASTGVEYRDIAFSGLTNPDASSGYDVLGFSAALSFSLSLDKELKYDMKETVIDYEASRTSSDTAQKQLIRDVEKEFYNLLTLQSELAILEKNRELAEKRYRQAESNYENGFATDLEVLQARVTASSYKPELSQARSDLDTETRNFLILLGMDPGSGIRLTGDLTQPSFQPDLAKLLEQSPVNRQDIREQLIEIESLKNDLNITRTSGYSPSFTVSGSWSTNVDSPLDRGSWESDSWSDSGKIGLNLSVPLDPYIKGSGDSTDVSRALIEIKKAEISLALLIDRAWVEIMNLHQQISTAQEILEQASQNRDLAEKSYELTEESYRLGGVERLDVEDAQQSALSAGQDYLRSQYQYLSGLIDLKYALNLSSMEELFELNGVEGAISEN